MSFKKSEMRDGFTLTETIVGLLLISILFMIIGTGISGILKSLSSTRNLQKVVELETFVSRYINIKGGIGSTPITASEINQIFNGGTNSYPKVSDVTQTDVAGVQKYTVTIEYLQGKTQTFIVYRYKDY
ncbi:MAG TPA: prepilin-type N-terminal cleavage/methylation domain-containing protein [Fervidobacterium sp.]|nr:prepilin-type N-terminal cleavage/methylation domain-containing protein [Fervidobacterium sp.]HRV38624.1 prepilin-type N-terminal cleavage/methylation domain-containing protein [Fervidobacterium sp.]